MSHLVLSIPSIRLCIIPFKGEVLNKVSLWWFKNTKHIVPNHVRSVLNSSDILVRKCKPILLEFVVRGYITGNVPKNI